MAIHLRDFMTQDEFLSAYTGGDYVEPWVAYIEETSSVSYNKVFVTGIEVIGAKMVSDVPATGGTVDFNDCLYTIVAYNSDGTVDDVTSEAVVTSNSVVVESSMVEERHSAGTITVNATYDEKEASGSVVVYQAAFIPTVTGISIDDLTWVVDIPASGGTASKATRPTHIQIQLIPGKK